MRASYLQVQPAVPPPQPTEPQTVVWLQTHSQSLLKIISAMVGNDPTSMNSYLQYEGTGISDYEKVNKRIETIGRLLAP